MRKFLLFRHIYADFLQNSLAADWLGEAEAAEKFALGKEENYTACRIMTVIG